MKVKIIYEDWENGKWENEINEFIKDRIIEDIQFKEHKVFIMYKEEND